MSQEEDLIKVQNGVMSLKDYIEKHMNITEEQEDKVIGDYDIVEKDMRKVLFERDSDQLDIERQPIQIDVPVYKKAEEYNKLLNDNYILNFEVYNFKKSFWYKIYKLFK